MTVAREGIWEAEQDVFAHRHDAGSRAMHALLTLQLADLNAKWPDVAGEELTALQGRARELRGLIRVLETGPSIKPKTK